jgi:DNA-binding MarR family transcriptional regulator
MSRTVRSVKQEQGSRLSPAAGSLAEAFRETIREVIRLRGRDTHLGGAELSYAQLGLLSELFTHGELPVGELAAAARISPGAVTEMLDHLARAGHVQRARSPSDKRVVVCHLTPEGRALVNAKREAWEERWRDALDGVPDSDLTTAAEVLRRLRRVFAQEPGCGSQSEPPR